MGVHFLFVMLSDAAKVGAHEEHDRIWKGRGGGRQIELLCGVVVGEPEAE